MVVPDRTFVFYIKAGCFIHKASIFCEWSQCGVDAMRGKTIALKVFGLD